MSNTMTPFALQPLIAFMPLRLVAVVLHDHFDRMAFDTALQVE